MKNILILGGGFGGLVTAENLVKELGDEVQITLVSPQRTFTFYPALVRLAFRQLDLEEVTFDLEKKLNELNVRFIEGEVLHLKPSLHRVQIAGKEFNGDLSYDYLVIAMGRRLATEKMYGFFDHAHHLLGVSAAQKFGKAVDAFSEGDIVVGLSPDAYLPVPVCETAFTLATRFRDEIADEKISITAVFPETIDKAFGGAELSKELTAAFEKHNISVKEEFSLRMISKNEIRSKDDETISFDLLMLLPPFRGQARLSENRITDELNFVNVDQHMRVEGMNNAYAVGDIVSFEGPKLAHIAIGHATIAAENLALEIRGEEPTAVYYHEIASIIDQGGADSIYLHYGMWDASVYRLKTGTMWSLVKRVHDKLWRKKHKTA
ncbi:MAG: FAD-dependent oxidoreductase [Pyrinomonadaceae bacterium]|nr:FAD-dependent oxidoreductase [Pyrinomonadaceae bacterium]